MKNFIKIVDYYTDTENYIRKDCIYNIQTANAPSGYFIKYFINPSKKDIYFSEKFDDEETMNEVLSSVLIELNEK